MEKCNKPESKHVGSFPDVVPGDVVQINLFRGREEFLVCDYPAALVSLKNGKTWSRESLWGASLLPSEVKKVKCCYEIC